MPVFLETYHQLKALVETYGILPLFRCGIEGFSVEDMTADTFWWTGDPLRDPWNWRVLAANDPDLCYGKIFGGRAGFVSKALLPDFCNYGRNGYDFDSLYEEGLAAHRLQLIMRCYPDLSGRMPSFLLKEQAGFGKGREKGFEGAITKLQMMTYLTYCGFARKKNKRGEEYGWQVGVLCPMEEKFGALPREAYFREPEESLQHVVQAVQRLSGATESEATEFLK